VPQSVNFDRMADRYDATRGGLARGRFVAEELEPYLPKGRLLEIGVGTGLIATAFAESGWDVAGVDLSEQMLARAAGRIPGRIVRADAAALPITTASVDACLAVHVLHLVGDAPAVVAEVARVLRPGGRFAVVRGAENLNSSDVAAAEAEMQELLAHGDYARRWAQADAVGSLAEAVGLRCVENFRIVQEAGAVSPARAISMIEQRLWSRLWDLSAETWAAVVEPALARLRELPAQDRPRATLVVQPVVIVEAPGG
jgi:SAM-dependent methyltransferase